MNEWFKQVLYNVVAVILVGLLLYFAYKYIYCDYMQFIALRSNYAR